MTQNELFSTLSPCFSDHVFLVSDFCQLSCPYFLKFFTFFHCRLCILYFFAWGIGWIYAQDCSDSMNSPLLQWCDPHDIFAVHLPIAFSLIRRHAQCKHVWSCVSQCCCRFLRGNLLDFQISMSVFHDMFKFLVIWFNEEDLPQLSGIIELWFLRGPFLLCFLSRCIGHMLPHIWPYIVRSWCCLFPRESLPRTMKIRQVAFRSIKWILWSLSMHLIILSLHPRSSNHQYFSNNTSSDVCVVLVTSMYFSGIGNDSSFGMYSWTLGPSDGDEWNFL